MPSMQTVTMPQLMSVPLPQRPWIAGEILRAAHGCKDAMPLDILCHILTTSEGKASTDAITRLLNDTARAANMDALGGGPLRYRISKTWAGGIISRGNRSVRVRVGLSAKRPPNWLTKHQAWPMHLENLYQVLWSYMNGQPLYPHPGDTNLLDAAWLQLVGVSPRASVAQSYVVTEFIEALHNAPYVPRPHVTGLARVAWELRSSASANDHVKVNPTARSTEPVVWVGYGERTLLTVTGGESFISIYDHDNDIHAIHFACDPQWIASASATACRLRSVNLNHLKAKRI